MSLNNSQIAVIGLGAFGKALVQSLSKEGANVIAVDKSIEFVEEVKFYTQNAICFDVTDVNQLRAHGLTDVDVAVIAIGESFEPVMIVAMEMLNAGVKEVYARAKSPVQEQILKRLGITEVIHPERQVGERMGVTLHRRGIKDLLDLGNGLSVVEVLVPPSMHGYTLAELELRKRFGINVLTVNRPETSTTDGEATFKSLGFVEPSTKLQKGDKMVVLGGIKECAKIVELN
ncbi:TrkA family potassium uptake protein [bacterium]|nr:MAG: TrkA family potassium uptake protein [bacterium]